MTTKEIRQQMMDRINGEPTVCQDEADTELYEALPMTYSEVVRQAKAIREELGLSGALLISAEHYSVPTGYETFEWRAFYRDDSYQSPILKAASGYALIAELRATLESYVNPKADSLKSIGVPELCLKGGAA